MHIQLRSSRARTVSRAALAAVLTAVAAACGEAPTAPRASTPALSSPSTDVQSLAFNGFIRIGVIPSVTELSLGGTGAFEIVDRSTGAVLLTGENGSATVAVAVKPSVTTYYRLQVACTSSEATRDTWLAQAGALGYETYTEFVATARCWRLRIGRLTVSQRFSTDSLLFRQQVMADGLGFGVPGLYIGFTVTTPAVYRATLNGVSRTAAGPIVVRATTGVVRIGSRGYRGIGEARANSTGRLAGINELPIEEYLYGVVPWELPPVPYGLPEAQKAQAIAARTYALRNLGKRASSGYDLLATTSDQVYGGLAAEHPVSTAAVDATAGIVGAIDARLIDMLYHSTSGGWTANNEDVFSGDPASYLRGIPDAERGRAIQHVPSLDVFRRHANPTNLRAAAEGDFESDWSRYHRWVVEWTREEMARALSAGFGKTVKDVHDIVVTDRADQGRVREIRFFTDAGELVGTEDGIRSRLRYVTSTGSLASLRSTLFYIEEIRDPRTKAITGWKAYGGGWGHGVGMSQTGAVGMAERGRSFEEILSTYYQGISLVRWY